MRFFPTVRHLPKVDNKEAKNEWQKKLKVVQRRKASSLSSHNFSTLYLVIFPFFRLWLFSLNEFRKLFNPKGSRSHLSLCDSMNAEMYLSDDDLEKHGCKNATYMPSLRSSISTSNYSFLLSHWPEGHRPGMPKDVYSEMQIIWHVFKRGKRKVTQNWGFSLIFINY